MIVGYSIFTLALGVELLTDLTIWSIIRVNQYFQVYYY
jgi:hypothetical protein